ncbi:CRISPR-associated protein Cas4 [Salipaludibacillus aurantiacus]|uniref:CRISPR-associated exonuclease Cas4 n=1 Tax=Salipaludibacillus aurantiacus TaxID=1601833 RepID=A0A1H9W7R1_9BACI|nr:CRISPR-associated protein Cas4 [Salipaludibacillus aurantiacus]SES29980.1 CRISPR-associated exonuclease Cas4 [Salipaludibacillus aurantiacus]
MVYKNEENYLMLSGIQHFKFCKRQWALIHIEQQWEENVKTIEGQYLHKKADQPLIKERRKEKVIVRGLPIQSRDLGITGLCDVVEFIEDSQGVPIQGYEGTFIPVPVEYKRGKPKRGEEDILQLTAQAMCLEEMLVCSVNRGYVYYGETKHRLAIEFTEKEKDLVKRTIKEMHHYYRKRHTPRVKTGAFCNSCSLQQVCLPELMKKQSVQTYIERKLSE